MPLKKRHSRAVSVYLGLGILIDRRLWMTVQWMHSSILIWTRMFNLVDAQVL